MPRRGRANIGRRSRRTTNQRNYTARRTEEENAAARESARIRMLEHRARESQEAHEAYNEQQRLRRRQVRAQETHEAREQRLTAQRQRQQQQRLPPSNIERAAFRYEPDFKCSAHASDRFDSMSVVCPHCHAPKFPEESA